MRFHNPINRHHVVYPILCKALDCGPSDRAGLLPAHRCGPLHEGGQQQISAEDRVLSAVYSIPPVRNDVYMSFHVNFHEKSDMGI